MIPHNRRRSLVCRYEGCFRKGCWREAPIQKILSSFKTPTYFYCIKTVPRGMSISNRVAKLSTTEVAVVCIHSKRADPLAAVAHRLALLLLIGQTRGRPPTDASRCVAAGKSAVRGMPQSTTAL